MATETGETIVESKSYRDLLHVKTTAPPKVHEYGDEGGTYSMLIPTDVGTIFVNDMSDEHLEAMHEYILMVRVNQAMRSGSLDHWHNELDDVIDKLVQRFRDFQAMAERAERRMAHDQEIR